MAQVLRLDHVGVTVRDLEAVTAFFVGLGLEVEGRAAVEGEFLDTVVGLEGAATEIVLLRAPQGGGMLELSRFVRPSAEGDPVAEAHTAPGLRNLSFEVDALEPLVERLAADGYPLVGGVGEWEGEWAMASVRGPEGILVNLAQRLSGGPTAAA